jgi:hypothetical protein
MPEATMSEEPSILESVMPDRITRMRLATGLLQGVLLYFLYVSTKTASWPATNAHVFAPLMLVFLFVPVLLVSGLGHLNAKRIFVWALVASVVSVALGFYDIWRVGYAQSTWYGAAADASTVTPSALVILFAAVGFYIAHALVLAAASDNRRIIARYPTYFEIAWKLAIQIKFSVLFVGVLWLILWLGASLFMLVKLQFLEELLKRPWFYIPVTAFAFTAALHITDVRPGIVRGIRTLLLVLMSWLLPITTLIVAGFLVSLPFTGLEPLWSTRHATAVLLGASAVLVLLINAAFQGGELGTRVARTLRASAKVAAVLLLPIIVIGIDSLGLRVQQYGWTTDRVIAAACLSVAACYACGYLWAAVGRREWLSRIAPTNIVTAFVILAVLLALFTPLADPARLSVTNQLARLESGKVSVDNFDFSYLKVHGARYGKAALEKLTTTANGPGAATTRARAEAAIRNEDRWPTENNQAPIAIASDVAANITVWPKSKVLPPSFLNQNWADTKPRHLIPQCLTFRDKKCDAYLIDFNGDNNVEILLRDITSYGQATVLTQGSGRKWIMSGTLSDSLMSCKEFWQALSDGTYNVVSPLHKDLEVGGQRLHISPTGSREVKCEMLRK